MLFAACGLFKSRAKRQDAKENKLFKNQSPFQ
jgi:hypothetical protein